MWDLIVSVLDHCLSFCFKTFLWHFSIKTCYKSIKAKKSLLGLFLPMFHRQCVYRKDSTFMLS